ncbi:MAG: hypothetical protein NTZ46_02135 [Verrucomicrobia bacterium]|nr:hypothetical protein [Verrucomicrobiota bacterium]
MALIALATVCSGSALAEEYFFRSIGVAEDQQARRLDYIESKLGITRYDFHFVIPRDHKIVATFVSRLRGKPFDAGSGIYHIAPSPNPEDKGFIYIDRFAPGHPLMVNSKVYWDVALFRSMRFGFMIPAEVPQGAMKMEQMPIDNFQPTKDYTAWRFVTYSMDGSELFFYSLSIRMEPLTPDDKLGRVRKEPTNPRSLPHKR